MQLILTEKRKFNYLVLASLATLIAIWAIKSYSDGLLWSF